MKAFICPKCGWIRLVSRRKKVECFKCGETSMTELRLSYEQICNMSESEREDYAKSWRYIHNAKGEH